MTQNCALFGLAKIRKADGGQFDINLERHSVFCLGLLEVMTQNAKGACREHEFFPEWSILHVE
jgi:hypothetical protein